MKRFFALISILAAASMLTGCAGGESSDAPASREEALSGGTATADNTESGSGAAVSDTSDGGEYPQTDGRIDTKEPTALTPLPIELTGPDGAEVFAEEITVISGDEGVTPDTLTEDNWYGIETGGFAYLAEPSGLNYNNIENADIFDEGSMTFEGVPEFSPNGYRKYYVGDEICGLKIASATSNFRIENAMTRYTIDGEEVMGRELGVDGLYFDGSTVEFEGSITLTGYANCAVDDEGYTARNDIGFVPDNSGGTLPVLNLSFDPESGFRSRVYIGWAGELKWASEYPTFYIGNIYTEKYAELDFSGLPDDGSFVKVRLTLENISMRSSISWISRITADIADFEVME